MSRGMLLADPDFPLLKIAGNPELMREIFRRHLRPLARRACHIQDCLISRVRYRRAARCVLQYLLRLKEPGTGRELGQWVTGVIYAGDRAERIGEKLLAADSTLGIPEAFRTFEPVCFIPELRMLVQVFPYDRRLPTLPLLVAGPQPDLERLLLSRIGPGKWHPEAWNVEPIRYRAGLGAVLRYAVKAREAATGKRREQRFYLKVYREEEGGRTYQVQQALSWRAQAEGEGFTVGRPIAYLRDLRVLILEEAHGTSLQEVLLDGRDSVAALRKVARALAVFNQGKVATTRCHSCKDEIRDLNRAGILLQWACPHLRAKVEEIVGAVAAGLEEVPAKPTHRDLKPDHILLDGDRLALLDLDSFAGADPVLDPATLLAKLAGLSFRFPHLHNQIQAAARAFGQEYFDRVPGAWRRSLPLHYAGALLETGVSFFRNQEPGSPEKIAVLAEEARESLKGRIW